MRSGLVVLAIAALAGCSRISNHNGPGASTSAPRSKGSTGTSVALAFERHVNNAIDAGEGDPFVRYLRQKVAADPDNSAARFELAAQYGKQGAYELAVEHLRIALDRQPDSEAAARKLADTLRGADQNLEAIGVLVRYCDKHPDAPAALLEELALSEDEANALGEGERYHRRAIAANPNDDMLRNNLGYNFLRQANYGDAVHEFQAALQMNPKSEAARNNLGFALARLQQTKEALLQWSSISGPAAAHNNLAVVLIEQGKLNEARFEIQASLDFDRHNPAAIQNLQLLSELDGKPASFTIKSRAPRSKPVSARRWNRVSAAVAKFFRGEALAGRNPADGRTIASQSAK